MEIKEEPEDLFLRNVVIKQEYMEPEEKKDKHGKYLVEIPALFRDIIVKEEYSMQGDVLADTKDKASHKSITKEKTASPGNKKKSREGKKRERTKKEHECKICGKIFMRACILKNHYAVHIGKKIYECAHCCKKFALKAALVRHMLIHTTIHPISCTVCPKKLKNKVVLQQHMIRQHLGGKENRERRYECSICHQRFFQRYHMRRHILTIHERKKEPWFERSLENPHMCEQCGKGFRNKYTLARHFLVHSNERSFACTVCSRLFKQKYTLSQHMALHTTEKPFLCGICQESFTLKDHLKYHLFNKHFGNGQCPHCFKSVLPSYLKYHIAKQHPEAPTNNL